MSQQLTETLKSLRRQEHERWLEKGQDAPAWVFASTAGTALDSANIRHLFHRVLQKAGLRRIRVHDLRHTYASLLIQQGESLVYVKEQLGHSSIAVTVDVYGHLVPGGNRAAVDRLDDEPTHPIRIRPTIWKFLMTLSGWKELVSRPGIEPGTSRLRVCCSAN